MQWDFVRRNKNSSEILVIYQSWIWRFIFLHMKSHSSMQLSRNIFQTTNLILVWVRQRKISIDIIKNISRFTCLNSEFGKRFFKNSCSRAKSIFWAIQSVQKCHRSIGIFFSNNWHLLLGKYVFFVSWKYKFSSSRWLR